MIDGVLDSRVSQKGVYRTRSRSIAVRALALPLVSLSPPQRPQASYCDTCAFASLDADPLHGRALLKGEPVLHWRLSRSDSTVPETLEMAADDTVIPGIVKNGVVVPQNDTPLPDGAHVGIVLETVTVTPQLQAEFKQ